MRDSWLMPPLFEFKSIDGDGSVATGNNQDVVVALVDHCLDELKQVSSVFSVTVDGYSDIAQRHRKISDIAQRH